MRRRCGPGSTPRSPSAGSIDARVSVPPPRPSPPPIDVRALIVEDDDACATAIAAHMRLHGFFTDRAGTLAEAREALYRFRPVLISVDLNLPDGHGFDFVREARAFGVEQVIVVSGERQRDNVIATLEHEVVHYLVKPMRLSELLRALLAVKASLAVKRDGPGIP